MSKARPILFSSSMVRALLAGMKVQTRRALKPQPPAPHVDFGGVSELRAEIIAPTKVDRHGEEYPGADVFGCTTDDGDWCLRCPYGGPGDLLWVRETMLPWITASGLFSHVAAFKADGYELQSGEGWTSAIHMPRKASRLTLRITDVRVQRLQEISELDAQSEGCAPECMTASGNDDGSAIYNPGGYLALWESINGAGSWAANPWVWALTFVVIRRNVDSVLSEAAP